MNFIKKVWLTFRQLKTWLQIIIVLVIISLFGALGGNGSSSTDLTSGGSPSSEPSSTSSPEVTSEETSNPTTLVSDSEFKSALSKMRIERDEVKNLKFYYDKSSPKYRNRNAFEIYVGQAAGGDPYLRFNIQYFGSDWLFIQSYFFNVDGDIYQITPSYGEINTDNNTDVWEWYDVNPSSENLEMIQKIIKSKKTVVRLEGRQYYKDIIITQTQKTALKNVLTVFQGLGGKL